MISIRALPPAWNLSLIHIFRPLIALLKVIDNPAQDIYLAAAMLGPLFGFTDGMEGYYNIL